MGGWWRDEGLLEGAAALGPSGAVPPLCVCLCVWWTARGRAGALGMAGAAVVLPGIRHTILTPGVVYFVVGVARRQPRLWRPRASPPA